MILVLPRPSLVKFVRIEALVKVLQFSFPGKIGHLSQELLSKLSLKNTLSRKKKRHSSIVLYVLVQINKLVCTNMFWMARLHLVGSLLVQNAHSLGLIPRRAATSIPGAPLWFRVHSEFQECPDSFCASVSVFLRVIYRSSHLHPCYWMELRVSLNCWCSASATTLPVDGVGDWRQGFVLSEAHTLPADLCPPPLNVDCYKTMFIFFSRDRHLFRK